MKTTLAAVPLLAILLGLPVSAAALPETVIPCSAEPTDMPITYGTLVSCEINPIGDLDVFRFSGIAGETALVMTRAIGPGIACSEIRDPDGVVIPTVCSAFGAPSRVPLTKTGLHSIQVRANSTPPLTYGLLLERAAPPSPTASSICRGCTLTGLEIDPSFDLDLYAFEGRSGDSITVSVGTLGGTGTPCVQAIKPSGNPVNSDVCGASPSFSATLTETGPHVIMVYSLLGTGTVTHNLLFQCFGSCPEPPAKLTCDIQLDKSTYADGEAVMTTLRLANHLSGAVRVEIKLWLDVPGYGPYPIANVGADGSLPLPPGFDQTYGPAPFFLVVPALPRGNWGYNCRMLDATTGDLRTLDLNPFRLE